MSSIKQPICFGGYTSGQLSGEQVILDRAKIGYESVEIFPQECW